jgi:hypothetical protein
MANLNQISTQTGMNYGTIQNNWDALKDDFDAVAYLPFGDEYWDAMNQIMNAIGNREIAKQPIVKWFELTRMEVPFTVETGVTIATTGTAVDLAPADIATVGGSYYTWPAINEIWRHATTGALVQVINKSITNATTATLTLKPLLGSTIVVASGDKFFYVGVSVKENSDSQASKYTFDTQYESPIQTMRHDALSSSEALYNQLWYSQLENGVQTPYSNSRDVIYLQREHQVAIVNTFLAGVATSDYITANNANLSNTESFQTTEGLLSAIGDRGQEESCGGQFAIEDMYSLEAKLTSQDASVKNYMVWTTASSSAAMEQALLDYNKNANITLNKTQMEKTFWGEGAYADLMKSTYSFNNVVFNNKNFGLVRMGIFDNPQTFNVAGSNWSEYAVFLPLAQGGIDDGLGNMGKYIRLCHKPGAFMNMWQTGGRAAANRTSKWELGIHIVSEIGFKFVNANKYGLLTETGGYAQP